MLLQRLELKGFLSHFGRENSLGTIEPVEIDFRSGSLWLIHGPNGAGKSALFDAISFALYKFHRGGKSGFHRLIHDEAKKAEIGLEIQLRGRDYLIQRSITRTSQSARVWGMVRQRKGDSWVAIPGTENKVERWVGEQLRFNEKTFMMTALLRQGEADAFLKAQPAERKEHLLELLDLSFYRKLGEAARDQQKKWKNEAEKLHHKIEGLEKIDDAQIQAFEQKIEEHVAAVANAKISLAEKEKALSDARTARDLTKQIEARRRKQAEDEKLLAQADEILANAKRFHVLASTLPLLDALWRVKKRLRAEQDRVKRTRQNISATSAQWAGFSEQFEAAQKSEQESVKKLEKCTANLEAGKEKRLELSQQFVQVERIENLNRRISEAENSLAAHASILKKADRIEKGFQRLNELREFVPKLEDLKNARKQLAEDEKSLTDDQQKRAANREKLEREQEIFSPRQKTVDEQREAVDALREALNASRRELAVLQDKLNRRKKIEDEAECPTCGSALNTEETKRRIAEQNRQWAVELEKHENLAKSQTADLKRLQQEVVKSEKSLTAAQAAIRGAEKFFTRAESACQHAETTVARQKALAHAATKKCGDWIDELPNLKALQSELEKFRAAADYKQKLDAALREKGRVDATVAACQTQLSELPDWGDDECQNIRKRHLEIEIEVAQSQKLFRAAERKVDSARTNRESLEKRVQELSSTHDTLESRLLDCEERQAAVREELDQHFDVLSESWRTHAACEDENALQTLRKEHKSLTDAEDRELELRAANERMRELAGAIKTFESQLRQIPKAHRRPVAEVQRELGRAQSEMASLEDRLTQARQTFFELQNQKKLYESRMAELKKAELELGYFQKLAKAFGRDGLRTRIIQQAQDRIKLYANETLSRLSNGAWQIELRENEKNVSELEILARDLRHPGAPLRSFEYLSGGEKFRVAISIAVAIGQAISGGRTVETLIIDEGFGALDEVNRGLLVQELHRLSEQVLKGGRVIIVSHQDDVCEEFGHRYRLHRHENGSVTAERSF